LCHINISLPIVHCINQLIFNIRYSYKN
jgi:hypothetical protein